VIIERARRFAAKRVVEDPRYTKHPANYLRGGCWEGEQSGAPVID
jgi:hypothetical protein